VAVKSVIDIDVNDAHFKRFTELFNKYRDAVAKQPEAWKKVGASTKSTSTNFETMAAAMMAQSHMAKEVGRSSDQSNKTLTRQQGLWNTIHRSTTGVFKNVTGIAKLLTEMGIGLGLGALGFGIGSLFGLMSLAKSTTGQRTKANSLGIPMGYAEAFGKFQGGNLSNPMGMLQGAVKAKFPGQESSLATMLGVNPMLGNAYQLSDQILLGLRRKLKTRSPQFLEKSIPNQLAAWGLSLGDLMNIQAEPKGWFQKEIREGTLAAPQLGVSKEAGVRYQEFGAKVSTSWDAMVTDIKNSLIPLLGPIQNLMSTVSKDFGFLTNGKNSVAKKGIGDLANVLTKFSTYVGSGGFTKAIQDFGDDVKGFSIAVQHFGFGFGAVGNVFRHPINSISGALDWYTSPTTSPLGMILDPSDYFFNKKHHPRAHASALEMLLAPSEYFFTHIGSFLNPTPVHNHITIKHYSGTGSDLFRSTNSGSGGH